MIKTTRYLVQEIDKLPNLPGVYYFYNKKNRVIYVGKAKDLKKRVASYFAEAKQISIKTQKLVYEVYAIEVAVVNSEYEALLLENNLIKAHQPRYNILLKDDKSYPYICVTNERFSRLIVQRNPDAKMGRLYGPFTSTRSLNELLDLIKELCPIRTCGYNLSEDNIAHKKFKVCLKYHIGNCLGPCAGHQSLEDYDRYIARAVNLLKGNFNDVRKDLKEKMIGAAAGMNYEKAQFYKNKLDAIDQYQSKSIIMAPGSEDLDVFGVAIHEEMVFIHYLQVLSGAISFTKTVEFEKKLDETIEEILPMVMFEVSKKYGSPAREWLTNVPVDSADLDKVRISVPQIGEKKKLVLLGVKNALLAKQDFIQKSSTDEEKSNQALKQLQKDLLLSELPMHIECFDNSNLHGTNPVASMVCFKGARPAKKDYRHYNIKTVLGANDFDSMYEIVFRRYKDSESPEVAMPNLIVIDGGKGQLNAAVEALRALDLYGKVAIISIAKRLEEIYFPNDSNALHISKKSQSLKLLQRIRDKAHRFALEFHRKKRSDSSLKGVLDGIPGLGRRGVEAVLQKFDHVENVRQSSFDGLCAVVGKRRATIIKNFFNAKE